MSAPTIVQSTGGTPRSSLKKLLLTVFPRQLRLFSSEACGIRSSLDFFLLKSFLPGNTFQFGTSNTPLYSVEVNGFDLDGLPFAQTLTFNTSVVAATGNGLETKGTWGNNEIGFVANSDLKIFTVTLNTANVSGTIIINSESSFRTGCGGTKVTDSPFFDQLVSDGRPLTAAEVILYRKTGWRITAPGMSLCVNARAFDEVPDRYPSSWIFDR